MASPVSKHVIEAILATAIAILVGRFATGCDAHVNDPREIEAAYTAELLGCVETAKTKQEADDCRKAVNRKYGLCDQVQWPRISPCD